MKCKYCEREKCKLHIKAYKNIIKKYSAWKKTLDLSWKEYLNEIVKNSFTGECAKEVARHLLNEGEKLNVKES